VNSVKLVLICATAVPETRSPALEAPRMSSFQKSAKENSQIRARPTNSPRLVKAEESGLVLENDLCSSPRPSIRSP
jgi:hypothetical protein